MAERFLLTVQESCALLGISRRELYYRLDAPRPNEARTRPFYLSQRTSGRTLVDLRSLPFPDQQRWHEANRAESPAMTNALNDEATSLTARPSSDSSFASPSGPESRVASPGSRQMSLALPQSEAEKVLAEVVAEISQKDPAQVPTIVERFHAIQPIWNHDYKMKGYRLQQEHVRAVAAQIGLSEKRVWALRAEFSRLQKSEGMRAAIRSLALQKPGPRPGTGSPLQDDDKTFITECWIFKKLTRKQTYEAWREYKLKKAATVGGAFSYSLAPDAGHDPESKPGFYAVVRYINEQLSGDLNPARGGREAVKTAAGHIIRHYNDELAGDAWCMDEWELNGSFFDAEDMRQLVGYGEKNPTAHVISIIDERTTYIIDWTLAWNVTLPEATFAVGERVIRNHWLPERFVSDRGGHFRQLVRGRRISMGRDELVRVLAGPLGELGVVPRGSEEKNPRANRIERMHREYSRRSTAFGVSYKAPLDTRKRSQVRPIDEQVKLHLKSPTAGHLKSIQEAERIIARWVEEINNGPTKAKGCKGLTRREAWEHFRPSPETIAARKPAQAAVDYAFAERGERTVQPGGMVELSDGRWYRALELAAHRGEKVRYIRYRRDPASILLLLDGHEDAVEAEYQEPVGTKEPEKLAQAIEQLKHARNVLAGELKARESGPETSGSGRDYFSEPPSPSPESRISRDPFADACHSERSEESASPEPSAPSVKSADRKRKFFGDEDDE